MKTNKQSEQMLEEIRNMLVSNNNVKAQDFQSITDKQVARYLQQSFQLVGEDDMRRSNPQLVSSKISQASVLLADENMMIKNYVKDKIQSQVFATKQKKQNSKQYAKLIEKRQQLQKKRLMQKIEFEKNIQNMIESTRKYKKYENKNQVPLLQIQSLIQKQQIDYDKIVKEQYSFKSINNTLKSVEPNANQSKNQSIPQLNKNYSKKKSNKSQDFFSMPIQIQGQQLNEAQYLKSRTQTIYKNIQTVLMKNKNFFNVFKKFLEIQNMKLQNDNKIEEHEHQNFQHTYQKPKRIYKFPNKLESTKELQNRNSINISQLSYEYKFKPFMLTKYDEVEEIYPSTKKVVSKRIGQSNKFHIKQCLVQNSTFYYADQQENGNEIKKSNMKSIQINVAPIEIIEIKKQQGGLFSRKQTEIQAVMMKGKNKNFVYQLNFAEGPQLTKEINKVNLRRLHKMSCVLRGSNNKDMEKFIQEQHTVFDLSQKYIRPEQEYSNKAHRVCFITLITSLLPQRKNVQTLNLSKCKLSFAEIHWVIRQCERNFTAITNINLSNTKLDRQALKTVLNLVKKCPTTLNLNLSYCQLDDDVIDANAANLATVCSKINNLVLEGNEITGRTIKILRNAFSSKISQLKSINVSSCPIQDFGEICSFIKSSNKLQSFIANACKLSFNNYKQTEDLLISTQQKQQFKKLQLRRNFFNGTIKWFEQMGSFVQVKIDLPIKSTTTNSNPIQSKFLRIQFANIK